ncbi:hypothetical protein BN1708_020278, partial [Verticillium longisporum]
HRPPGQLSPDPRLRRS